MDAYIMKHMNTASMSSAPQTGMTFLHVCMYLNSGLTRISGNSGVRMQIKFANGYLGRVVY